MYRQLRAATGLRRLSLWMDAGGVGGFLAGLVLVFVVLMISWAANLRVLLSVAVVV